MVTFKHVLYPTDLSQASRSAIPYAAALARWYGAQLTVLHAVPTFEPIRIPSDRIGTPTSLVPPPTREDVEAEVRAWLGPSAFEGLETIVLADAGDPVRVIADQSVAQAVDLIVMGTHGRRGFDRLLSGSVTERVLRASRCPVLTVPPGLAVTSSATAVFHRILCPVEFSASSRRALDLALDLARQANGTVTVVTVIEWPEHGAGRRASRSPRRFWDRVVAGECRSMTYEAQEANEGRTGGSRESRTGRAAPSREPDSDAGAHGPQRRRGLHRALHCRDARQQPHVCG